MDETLFVVFQFVLWATNIDDTKFNSLKRNGNYFRIPHVERGGNYAFLNKLWEYFYILYHSVNISGPVFHPQLHPTTGIWNKKGRSLITSQRWNSFSGIEGNWAEKIYIVLLESW